MEDELILADLGVVERRLERLERELKKSTIARSAQGAGRPGPLPAALEDGRPLRALELTAEDAAARGLPVPVGQAAAARAQPGRARRARRQPTRSLAGLEGFMTGAATRAVPICAKIELEIAQLDEATPSVHGRSRAARVGARPGHSRELRPARLRLVLHRGRGRVPGVVDSARHAGTVAGPGEIHSDISRGFIRAEVVRYEHLLARGSIAACRDHGELRLEGKEYVVLDGDVINFRHAT
jgi:ribosome-binding ATPase